MQNVCDVCADVGPGVCFGKNWKMCAKVQICKISHTSQVRNVCDVRAGVAAGVNLGKNAKMSAKVRTCEISHVRTLAKCVQCACKLMVCGVNLENFEKMCAKV